ncbi:hypothetical protein [Aureisphaera sp.]
MSHAKSQLILLAHRNWDYAKEIEAGLKKEGTEISEVVYNAFEALGYILLHHPLIALLEHDFSYLSATDIANTIKQKHIRTQIVHILPKHFKGIIPDGHYFYENDSIEDIEEYINLVASKVYKNAIGIENPPK